MSKRLAGLCGSVLAVALTVALAAPASAQIIIGGQPVTSTPGEPAPAQLTFPLNPDSADYKPVSVSAPTFSGATPADTELAAKIAEVIRADLASTGLFVAPDATTISTFRADIGALPVWSEWSGASVGAVLFGKVETGADNSLSVQFRFYDIAARTQVIGSQYRLPSADQWRRAAHKVADDVMVALVGGKAGFDSRIVYAAESGGKTRLGAVDSDGANSGNIIESVTGLASPRFSPVMQTIVYSADAPVPGKPTQAQRTTILYDMTTGRRDPLTTGAQPNADGRYSADGVSLIYSRKQGANTDIYQMALATRKETKLTDDKAADTEPALSPDGKRYVFVSERAGASQLFVANVDGSPLPCSGAEAKACQITTDGGGYATPVWSPTGSWIAYTRRTGAQSAVYIVRADGADARALTTPGKDVLDLHPTWSPDGRRIAFARLEGQRSHIAVTNLAGAAPQRLDTQGDAYEPDWGPKLP